MLDCVNVKFTRARGSLLTGRCLVPSEGNLINDLAKGVCVEGDALVLEVGVVVGWGGEGKGG